MTTPTPRRANAGSGGHCGSTGCVFGRGVRGHRDRDGPGAQSARGSCVFGSLAAMAHGHQLCGELPLHRHHLDQSPLPHAVRRRPDVAADMDKFRPSLHGVALAFCDGVGGAHQTLVARCRVLRRAVRRCRHCVQPFRARSAGRSRPRASVGAVARVGRGVDRSSSLRRSRPPCSSRSSRSSRRVSASCSSAERSSCTYALTSPVAGGNDPPIRATRRDP